LTRRDIFLLSAFAVGGLTLLGFNFRNKTKQLVKPPAPPESISSPENPRDVSLILTGDVLLGRTVMTESIKRGNLNYPFEKVGGVLRQADLVFINLENPVVEGCPKTYEGFVFCTDPVMLEGLKFAGVDVANLANNHSRDYGEEGLTGSVGYLEGVGVEPTGLGSLVIKEVEGTKFGFLGFSFVGVGRVPKPKDYELINESANKVDILIVGVHWGEEYSTEPAPEQRAWARKMVEEGADVIVGHHPHVIQSSEKILGKPVYYSLGNFVFDQMWSEETKKGLVIRLAFREGKLISEEELPTYISSLAQPEFVED